MLRIKKVLNEAILVELEPICNKSAILAIRGAESVRVGRVLMAGTGKTYKGKGGMGKPTFVPMPDIVGKRVAFLAMAIMMRGDKHGWLPNDQALIRIGDLMLELDDDADIEIRT